MYNILLRKLTADQCCVLITAGNLQDGVVSYEKMTRQILGKPTPAKSENRSSICKVVAKQFQTQKFYMRLIAIRKIAKKCNYRTGKHLKFPSSNIL